MNKNNNNKMSFGVATGFVIGAIVGVFIGIKEKDVALWLSIGIGFGISTGIGIGGIMDYKKSR